jgi:signal peptidase II
MRKGVAGPLGALLVLSVLLADRASKVWALRSLEPRGEIPYFRYFALTYVENTGVAFGMFRGRNSPLILISVLLIAGLLWWRRTVSPTQRLTHASILLVVGGALGNLYDRIAYGFVVDFFDFKVWPVFNVADSCITVGACLLAFSLGKD